MPSTNGHGPPRAILYTRVSGDRQRDHGYSLSDQRRELEQWAAKEGYEVLEAVEDGAWSGGDLVRPGLDRVRDLVASQAGGVDAVVTLFRDRLARGVYAGLLAQEFAEHGCRLIALNAQIDDSPEGELHGGMLDLISAWERKKTAERTRRGKFEKARQGKIIGNQKANLGFRYDEARDGLEVDEKTMPIVREIFRAIGAEGQPIYAAKKELERQGIRTPYGKRSWSHAYVRKIVRSDVYRPHTYEEITKLVSTDVAARLDEDKRYGIWWWGRQRHTQKQTSESTPEGRRYHKSKRSQWNPEEQWIAVPVPDSGIPREWVDAARENIKDNARPQSSGLKFYELAGMAYCGSCGRQTARTTTKNKAGTRFFYYRCMKRWNEGKESCQNNRSYSAKKTEAFVWEVVRAHMTEPDRLRRDLERMIELKRQEMRGDPEREAKAWLQKLAEADSLRAGYQEQAARGLMTLDELATRLSELEETRKTARVELEAAKGRAGELELLEQEAEVLLESYEAVSPEDLDALSPEERNRFYGILGIKAWMNPDKSVDLELSGVPIEDFFVCNSETASGRRS